MLSDKTINLSEWYMPQHKDIFVYFDSWQDLAEKVQHTDFTELKQRIKNFAENHHIKTLKKWSTILNQLTSN